MELYYCERCNDQYVDGQVISNGKGKMSPSCSTIVKEVNKNQLNSLLMTYYCKYCNDIYSYGQSVPNIKGLLCPNCLYVVKNV